MLAAQKEKGGKKSQAPAMDARKEMSKSKEQVEEEMKISLSIRIKPLPLESMDSDELRSKANAIWNTIVELETDKYDYEQRRVDQDYELKELNERRKLQLRNKAIKKGLDPEAFCGSHPPKIHMFSNTKGGQTPVPTATERSSTKVEPKSFAPSGWNKCGRKSWENGTSVQRQSCPSGAAFVPARRRAIPRLQRVRKRLLMMPLRRNMMKKRRSMMRRRKRNKQFF